MRAQHLVRGTGLGSLDEVETYHDRIRETVVNMLTDETSARAARVFGEASSKRQEEQTQRRWPCISRLASWLRRADTTPSRRTRRASHWPFDRAVKLYRHSLDLGPSDLTGERRILSRLGDALSNVGRSVEAANAYQKAAIHADQIEQIELQRRAAYQFLVSGHIDEGLSAYGAILDPMGLSLPSTPRRALFRLLLSRARLGLRGLKFSERPEASVPRKSSIIDIFRSVRSALSST